MHPRNLLPASAAALSCAVPASAGFVGWTARTSIDPTTSTVFVDVFAGFDGTTDRVLNVYDADIVASGATFLQASSVARKAWSPEIGQTSVDRDSFMTLGTEVAEGIRYASTATAGDPGFTSFAGAWNGTPGSAPSTTVPDKAGWYASNPASAAIVAEALDGAGAHGWQNRSTQFGVWVAHFAFDAGSVSAGANISFTASIGSKPDANPGGWTIATDSRMFLVPGPWSLGLAAVAGIGQGRRRRRTGSAWPR
jgi:hypothetical protein